jgi:LysR family glycine cleavage system transcriptional activator
MPRLPPLNALRAFDAAARHLSMKAASEELHVTPGAVSQLVRVLEDRLGVRLFRRLNRRLVLTEAGQSYVAPIRNAFRQIGEATRRLEALADAHILTVSAPPAFAASWLVPRLGRFREQHPDIDLRILTSRDLADFAAGEIDVAIRHGLGRYKGLRSDRIAAVVLMPVCSPALLAALGVDKPARAEDLARLPLLHDAQRQDWALWFQAQGVEAVARGAMSGPSFDDQTLLIRAASSGQGVALVTEALAAPELECGGLVAVTDAAWPQEFAYWLVSPQAGADQPKVAAFRHWLLAESAQPISAKRTEWDAPVLPKPKRRRPATAALAVPPCVPPRRAAPAKPRAPRAATQGGGSAGSPPSSE